MILSYALLTYTIIDMFFSYWIGRDNKWSILYQQLPEKLLISNEKILKYLLHPINRVPKWFFVWHILTIIYFAITLICYMFFWFGVSNFITTGYAYLAVFILSLLTSFVIYIVDGVYKRKYIGKNI